MGAAPTSVDETVEPSADAHVCTWTCFIDQVHADCPCRPGQDAFLGACGKIHRCPEDCEAMSIVVDCESTTQVCRVSGRELHDKGSFVAEPEEYVADEGQAGEQFGTGLNAFFNECYSFGYSMTKKEAAELFESHGHEARGGTSALKRR